MGGSVYCARYADALTANRTRTVFGFASLESCKTPSGKDRTFVGVSGLAENSTGFARFSN